MDSNQIYILHTATTTTRDDDLEVPLWGFDGEVGVRVPLEMAGIDPHDAELRLYGGGFYFDASEAPEEIAGPRARAELRFYDVIPGLTGSRLTAEYEYSYDDVRGTRHKGGARLRIPFGHHRDRSWVAAAPGSKSFAMQPASRPLTRQERRMLDGIEREDIFTTIRPGEQRTETTEDRELVGDYLTGVVFEKVAYVDGGGDLSGTSAAQGANTLIIVRDGVVTTDGTHSIEGSQTIQGGGSTIPVFGVASGTVFDFTAPGTRPTVETTGAGEDVMTLQGNHTHIAGLEVDGNGVARHGINNLGGKSNAPIPPGTWNIVIENSDIHDLTGDGIRLGDDNARVWIFTDTITNVGGTGILMGDGNDQVGIMNVGITNAAFDGIAMSANNSNISISDASIATTGGDGIRIGNSLQDGVRGDDNNRNILITNADITGAGRDGIFVSNQNSNLEISETTITNAANDGISLGSGNDQVGILTAGIPTVANNGIRMANQNTNVEISDTTITNAGGDGIEIGNDNQNVLISGVDMRNLGSDGIEIRNDNQQITIEGGSIDTTNGVGIGMGDENTQVAILDGSITNTGFDGIRMFDLNANIVISGTTISAVGRHGVQINDGNRDVVMSNNDISNTGGRGIHVATNNERVQILNHTITDTGGAGIWVGLIFFSVSSTVTTVMSGSRM